ncbi:MAG TPA: zf-HC2 domain-containing protein [Actinomycetota bacterium]|nr:zf-HC2 domain-containing protein [Actinomycetota bacterium]
MSHPDDLLADYVDGTLAERERAVVDAHLTGCARCSAEVRQAAAARAALNELEDVPVPFGVTGPVLAEAGRRFERRPGVVWGRFQWAAGLAAAAALVLVVALNLGGEDTRNAAAPARTAADAGGTGAAGAEAAAPAAIPFAGLEHQADVNYDEAGIHAVASEAADAVLAAEDAAGSQAAFASGSVSKERTSLARDCIDQSGVRGPNDALIRLIQARFEGTPAFIGVFAEGPGAGQAPDHIVVFVVATDDCRILSTASQRIPPG